MKKTVQRLGPRVDKTVAGPGRKLDFREHCARFEGHQKKPPAPFRWRRPPVRTGIIDFGHFALARTTSVRAGAARAQTKRTARGEMAARKSRKLSRRDFVRGAGVALAAGAIPSLACGRKGKQPAPGRKSLKILQWSHFIPAYDRWFDGVYTKSGERITDLTSR